MALKKGKPSWLQISDIVIAEEKTKPDYSDKGIKQGSPTWLSLEEPEKSSDSPDWLDSSAQTPSWLEKDEKGNVVVPDLNKYNNWNLEYLREKDRNYLEQRGFLTYCRGHDPKVVKSIIKQIQYMERRVEQNITLDKVIKSNLPMIREKAELEELKDLKSYIDDKNLEILSDLNIKLDFKFPKSENFKFNTDAESQHYQLTHVAFDVENRLQDQKPIACGAYNLETNRLCIAINSKYCPEKTGEFYLINENIYLIYTPNLWEALFVADVEVLLSTIFESALMSGHNHFISILEKLKLPEKLKINNRILEEYLNGFPKRRSVWIGHNARFDIDMLNDTHKKAGYKFTFFQKRLKHDVIPYYMGRPIDPKKLKTDKEIKSKSYNVNHYAIDLPNISSQKSYKVHLGNHDAGFKFRVTVDNYSGKTIYRANLSPIQHQTFTHLWITDTIIVSFAMQNPEHSLKALSKDTKFEKRKSKDYNFPLDQLNIYTQEKVTEPVKYLMFDLFSTLAVYEKESQQLNYSEMEKLIRDNGTPDFELKIDWRPRMANLLSTATIAKQFIIPYLEAKTGLKRSTILNNISHERKYLTNFERVYQGGVSEPIIYGMLESNFKTDERIFYDDYESLYPSVARLIFADLMYQLASKKELHNYLKTDTEQTKIDFWDNMEKIIKIIRKAVRGHKIELPEDIFQKMIGTVQIYTTQPLQIRTTNENKRKCWKKLIGKHHLHLIDLMNSILRAVLEFDIDIHTLYNHIHFINAERLDFSKITIPEFGDEFFTLLMKLRREKKSKEDYDPVEKMLKYIINSGIGVTAEGISSDDDFVGKLFIPVIFASVTAGSRFLAAIPEVMIKILKGKMGYTDTDSLIYKIKSSLRPRITQLFDKLSKLKEEKDYGTIIKAFIAKKKKYYLLSKNINVEKFKKQHIKLPDGNYIVGKVHGVSSYEKRLYVKTIFPIVNELMNNFTIKEPKIQAAVRKHLHKHPRFMNITYKKKTETKIKGVLYFFQKTRAINVEYEEDQKKVKTKIRIPNPVFTLHKTQFDGFDIYFYYDLSANKILITNLDDKPIRSNFGIYTNLGKKRIKIFYTIPIEDQLDWENRFLKLIIKTFYDKQEEFFFEIQKRQADFIINFLQNTKKFLQEEFDESLKIDEENIDKLFETFFNTVKSPIPKTKRFFNRTYAPQEFKGFKASPQTKRWLEFANDYDTFLMGEFGKSNTTENLRDTRDIIQGSSQDLILFNKLLTRLGLDSIHPPTVREMQRLASENNVPGRSKMDKKDLWFWTKDWWWQEYEPHYQLEYLHDRIQEMKDYSPDGRIHWIIDQLMDTETVEYSHYLDTVKDGDIKLELTEHNAKDTLGKQFFDNFIHNVIETFVKEAINKTDLEIKLIKQFGYNKDDTSRYIYETHEKYLDLRVTKQKQEVESKEMLTHTILDHEYYTDGVDYRLWSYLPELDFSEELVANQNSFYSQNLINLGRIGTYIYYLTHNRAKQIPNIWSTDPTELPCPKTNRQIHIPFRMRLLLDTTKLFHSLNDIKLAFNYSEVNKMLREGIIEQTKDKKQYKILNFKDFNKFNKKQVFDKAYMIIGKEKPESHKELFPIYHKRKYCKRAYAFEITSAKSYDYNCKMYIHFIVGENKKVNQRILSVDLHINPNSHNLLNIELFKANIKDLESDDFIVRELLLGLFTVKELAYFSRNASLTTVDMKKKEDLSYLRKMTYLFFSHAILEHSIIENSQTKIGILALTGQLVPKNIDPQTLFSFVNKAIIDEHTEWINSLEPEKALKVQAREISVMPHRSSFGLTINHWKNKIHLSLYTKDRHWYKSKMSRTARSRNFEITEKLSKEIMGMVWEENTLRYEITLKGFDAIHCTEYHKVLQDLEQFFFQLDEIFAKKKQTVKKYKKAITEIRKILPNPLFKTVYKTVKDKITQLTGKWIKSKIDKSGYSHKLKTKDPPDPQAVTA